MLLLKYEKMNYSTPYAMMTNKRDARNYTKIENRKDFIKLLNHTTGMIIFHANKLLSLDQLHTLPIEISGPGEES
jgi:hypothetical protein